LPNSQTPSYFLLRQRNICTKIVDKEMLRGFKKYVKVELSLESSFSVGGGISI